MLELSMSFPSRRKRHDGGHQSEMSLLRTWHRSMSSSRKPNPRMRVIAKQKRTEHNHGRFRLTGLASEYRIRADKRSWRRAAYRRQSNRLWKAILGAVFVVVIVLTGLVQTRQNLGTMQSELETAERATDQAKARATEFAKRFTNLSSELEEVTAQRKELQTKLDQATSEANAQLEEKQSQLEAVQSELEAAKQVADQAKGAGYGGREKIH